MMQIDFGGICARCSSCGGEDFAPLRRRPDEPDDKLACTACLTEVLFDDLRAMIAGSALAAAVAYAQAIFGGSLKRA
jgi:hypothetical protein